MNIAVGAARGGVDPARAHEYVADYKSTLERFVTPAVARMGDSDFGHFCRWTGDQLADLKLIQAPAAAQERQIAASNEPSKDPELLKKLAASFHEDQRAGTSLPHKVAEGPAAGPTRG